MYFLLKNSIHWSIIFLVENSNPGMCEAPSYFEPTKTKRDSYIADWMSGLLSWKTEDLLRLPT